MSHADNEICMKGVHLEIWRSQIHCCAIKNCHVHNSSQLIEQPLSQIHRCPCVEIHQCPFVELMEALSCAARYPPHSRPGLTSVHVQEGSSPPSPDLNKASSGSSNSSQSPTPPPKGARQGATDTSKSSETEASTCLASTSLHLWPPATLPGFQSPQATPEQTHGRPAYTTTPTTPNFDGIPDMDWHFVTAPADSELPPALRQGSSTPPQRGPKRTRMLASFHAQTRDPSPSSANSAQHERSAGSMESDQRASPLTADAPTSPCMLPSSCTHGDHAYAVTSACDGLHTRKDTAQVTPPRIPRDRTARCTGGHRQTSAAATASKPASRIPRASANARLQAHRGAARPGRRATSALLPGDGRVLGWTSCLQFVLRWLIFTATITCAVTAGCLLGFHSLQQPPHAAQYPPRPADMRQLASLLDLVDTNRPAAAQMGTAAWQQCSQAGSAAGGHACDVDALYNRRGTFAAALEVVSAAEVAQGRLRVALGQAEATIPASWEKASAALEATLSDLKRTCYPVSRPHWFCTAWPVWLNVSHARRGIPPPPARAPKCGPAAGAVAACGVWRVAYSGLVCAVETRLASGVERTRAQRCMVWLVSSSATP